MSLLRVPVLTSGDKKRGLRPCFFSFAGHERLEMTSTSSFPNCALALTWPVRHVRALAIWVPRLRFSRRFAAEFPRRRAVCTGASTTAWCWAVWNSRLGAEGAAETSRFGIPAWFFLIGTRDWRKSSTREMDSKWRRVPLVSLHFAHS